MVDFLVMDMGFQTGGLLRTPARRGVASKLTIQRR
jgi:hypothetical protein